MKFFQKTWVAVVITLAMVAAAVGIGQWKGEAAQQLPSSTGLDTSLSTAAYEQWVGDGAGVLSREQVEQICLYNANWDRRYGSIIVVETLADLPQQGLEDYAISQAEQFQLGSGDGYLAVVPSRQDAYLAVGMSYPLSDSEVGVYLRQYLYEDLQENCGGGILSLFDAINQYYINVYGIPAQNSYGAAQGGSRLLGLVVLVVILLVIATVADRLRYDAYRQRYYGVVNPPVVFRPILFWHGPGWGWYNRRWRRPPPPPPPPRGPGGFGPGGFGGPRPGGGASSRPGGFGRSGVRGGGFGGSRGGSSRGGGFGGSRR